MPSVAELYNKEVLEGHREALAALRQLLAEETNLAERRKLANAILRARPVKLDKNDRNTSRTSPRTSADTARPQQPALENRSAPTSNAEPGFSELAGRAVAGPDREGELRELHTRMLSAATAAPQPATLQTADPFAPSGRSAPSILHALSTHGAQ